MNLNPILIQSLANGEIDIDYQNNHTANANLPLLTAILKAAFPDDPATPTGQGLIYGLIYNNKWVDMDHSSRALVKVDAFLVPEEKLEYDGNIRHFPIEVVEKMLEHQVAQGNVRDISVFERECSACDDEGGFDWEKSPEGGTFWDSIIASGNFDTFFNQYPKTPPTPMKPTYKITRAQLRQIHDIACETWKTKLYDLADRVFGRFNDEGELNEVKVREMFEAATAEQLPVLKSIFPTFIITRIPEGKLAWVKNNYDHEWVVRVSNGKGGFYDAQKFDGVASRWSEVLPFDQIPETLKKGL